MKRVAIIGAGTSGLAAAVKLASIQFPDEVKITIYEARREPGGRTRSFVDPVTGDVLDNGQHLLMRSYVHTLDYLKTIGTIQLLKSQRSLNIRYFIKHRNSTYSLKLPYYLPTPFNLAAGLLKSDILALFEKVAATRLGLGVMLLRADKHAAGLTCSRLFSLYKQPESLVQKLWEPLVLGTMNTPIDKASAQVFVNIIRTIFFRDPRFSRLLFPKVGLSELLIDPAITYLRTRGNEILLATQITSISAGNGEIQIGTNVASKAEIYDAVIYTSTSYENHSLPESIKPMLPEFEYSPIVNAYLWVDNEILHHPMNGFIGTTLQWALPKSSVYSKQLISCTVSAGKSLGELSNEQIASLLWEDICSVIPAAKKASIIRSQVLKEKRATVLLTPELQASRPKSRTSVPNLFLAGDLVQNGLPMTIEGAVRNGQYAAKAVVKYLFPDFRED